MRRSKRRNIVERTILAALLVRPFRCEECRNRFFKWSLHKNVLPEAVQIPTRRASNNKDLLRRAVSRLNLHVS